MSRIAVIGAGAWGTALAIVLARSDRHDVKLWAFEKEVVESVNQRHVNELFLAGFAVPANVRAEGDLATTLREAEIVVSVMPSHHCRKITKQMSAHVSPQMMFVSATKGLENDSLLRMTEVIAQELKFPPRIGALSGPTFAKEVAKGDPTAITIASDDAELAATVQREFSDHTFRVYTNDDVAGV